ncbi:hypothetical protein P7K49_019465 [Saguinus oedipus]|uniref:Uncharacterized protein n=1 Tax=Saguinus oedipus TaxID=9490 RepID=A0ABQ9UYD3_SAGOE|nr:hypothetical protein P7K49_019465 [Saguinus oedipus]
MQKTASLVCYLSLSLHDQRDAQKTSGQQVEGKDDGQGFSEQHSVKKEGKGMLCAGMILHDDTEIANGEDTEATPSSPMCIESTESMSAQSGNCKCTHQPVLQPKI